jgi:plastocyanin
MSSVRNVLAALIASAPSLVLPLVFAAGCSANSGTSAGTDGGAAPDAQAPDAPATDAPAMGAPDSGLPVNGCGEADFAASDHTAANDPRVIQAPPGAVPQQYVPSCIRIKAGQTVTFVGDNADHPVDHAEVSGGMPYPILTGTQPFGDGGMAFIITVSEPGVVRFNCDIHPTLMNGAIEIVP